MLLEIYQILTAVKYNFDVYIYLNIIIRLDKLKQAKYEKLDCR